MTGMQHVFLAYTIAFVALWGYALALLLESRHARKQRSSTEV